MFELSVCISSVRNECLLCLVLFACSQGKIEESIKFLETFAETAEQGQQEEAYGQACSDLGTIFHSLVRRHLFLVLFFFFMMADPYLGLFFSMVQRINLCYSI